MSVKAHFKIHQIFCTCSSCAMAWCFSDGNAIHVLYVLLVLWMTSCFHIMEWIGQKQNKTCCICLVQFARWQQQSGVRQHCLLEFATWRHRGQSLPSPAAYC